MELFFVKATEQNCSCLGLKFLGRSSKIDPQKNVFVSHGKKVLSMVLFGQSAGNIQKHGFQPYF